MSGWSFARRLRHFFAAALVASALPALAQTAALEHEVKAAFLYRFLSFIDWTPMPGRTPQAPFVIAFAGAEDVAQALEKVVPNRPVQGRTVQVRRVRPGESLAGVHMVMVGRGAEERIPQLVRQNVLVVTEADDGLERGAAINFVIDDGRVRFEVSLPSAEKSGARISSRMLAVAYHVRGAAP